MPSIGSNSTALLVLSVCQVSVILASPPFVYFMGIGAGLLTAWNVLCIERRSSPLSS